MWKTRYFVLGALVLSLGAAPVLTYAGWGGGGPGGGGGHGRFGGPMMGGGPGMFLHMILKRLNLNETQQQTVNQIMETHRSDFQSKFGDLRIQQKKLETNFFQDPPIAIDPTDLQKSHDALMAQGLATAVAIQSYLMTQKDENDQTLWSKAVQLWQKMQTMREEMNNFFGEPQ